MHNDRSTFLVSITIPVEIAVLIIFTPAMVLALMVLFPVEMNADSHIVYLIIAQFTKYLHNDRFTFLVSITIPVEIVVIIFLPHAMVLVLKIEFFVVISVYQKTAGKTIRITLVLLKNYNNTITWDNI